MTEKIRILNLNVTDLKRIEAVNIRPKDNMIILGGENGSGKTSILDAIWWGLSGRGNIQSKPVREGADYAVIEMDLGSYKLVRKITPDGKGTIKVTNSDGFNASKPQDMLDGLVGELSFDPLKFLKKSGNERLEMLRSFAPDIDFEKLDKAIKDAFEERADVNRDFKKDKAILDAHPSLGELPELEDISDIQRRIKDVESENQNLMAKGKVFDDLQRKKRDSAQLIEDVENQIFTLEEQLKQLKSSLENYKSEDVIIQKQIDDFEDLPPLIAVNDLITEMQEIDARNREAQSVLEKAEVIKRDQRQFESTKAKKDIAEKALEEARQAKEDALKSIELPIEGLSFGEDDILYNGIPFDQASDARQLRVGVNLAIKANPKLAIVRIRDGSLLDKKAMKSLEEMANEHDFQVWIERVGDADENAIIIENGNIREDSK